MPKAAATTSPAKPNGSSSQQEMPLLQKMFADPDTVAWKKEELLHVLFIIKMVTGLVLGITCGVLPVTGAYGFAMYMAGSAAATFILYRSILKVDEEEFGGHGELLTQDQHASLALFILTWIFTYSYNLYK